MPAAYWVGDFSADARDARNWYRYNVAPTPGDDLYFYGAAGSGNFDEDIDGDGDVEVRTPGGDCLGLAGDWATVEVVAGYAGTITLGANPSSWVVGTPAPTPPTPTPFTGSGVSVQQLMLDAPGANIAQHHPLTGEVSPLTITGDIPWWATPLPASLTWYGGALNDTAVASTVTVTGATALIDSYDGGGVGTVTSGSTLNFVNASTLTILPGTLSLIGGSGINVIDSASFCQPAPPPRAPASSVISAPPGAVWTFTNSSHTFAVPTFSDTALVNNGSLLRVKSGETAEFRGQVPPPYAGAAYSIHQSSGIFVIENGATLKGQEGTYLGGGKLATAAVQAVSPQPAAILQGNLRNAGADIVISDPDYNGTGVSGHAYGRLRVVGNVDWTGGTYRPFLNGASGSTQADIWEATGSFSVDGSGGAKFGPNVVGLPAGTTVTGRFWTIMECTGASTIQLVQGGQYPGFDEEGVFNVEPAPAIRRGDSSGGDGRLSAHGGRHAKGIHRRGCASRWRHRCGATGSGRVGTATGDGRRPTPTRPARRWVEGTGVVGLHRPTGGSRCHVGHRPGVVRWAARD